MGNGYAYVFVMGDDVVYNNAFNIDFCKRVFREDSSFTSTFVSINNEQKEVIICNNSKYRTEFIADEMFTALILSDPKIIKLSFPKDRKVMAGWKYDGQNFYSTKIIDGEEKMIDGEGNVINE